MCVSHGVSLSSLSCWKVGPIARRFAAHFMALTSIRSPRYTVARQRRHLRLRLGLQRPSVASTEVGFIVKYQFGLDVIVRHPPTHSHRRLPEASTARPRRLYRTFRCTSRSVWRGERGGGWTAEPDGRRQRGRWRGPARTVPAQTTSLKYSDRHKQ